MKLSRTLGISVLSLFVVLLSSLPVLAQSWTAKLDKDIRFYQPTEMGVLIAGTEKSLYGIDASTGDSIWRSEKIKGAVMQTSVDPETNLLAVVLAKDVKSRARDGFKRRPLLHVLDLANGEELWKYEIGEVEMMPARWSEDSD